jgi:hypothetical protein
MMHGHEKSDPAIVAVKPANKAEQPAAERSAAEPTAAEPVEPRAGTKGKCGPPWRISAFLSVGAGDNRGGLQHVLITACTM